MAVITASGGNMPYAYLWPSGGNAAIENNLAAGIYNAAVTDRKGCKAFTTVVIEQPGLLRSAMTLQNTSCGNKNGSATVNAYGGTAPYQFEWTPGNITGASINNLAPGQYTVAIKDSNRCTIYDTAIIAPSSAINVRLSHLDPLCYGESTGNAEAFITGGTQPYHFQWTNGSQIFNGNPLVNLAAGTYNLSVEDATGCGVKAPVLITQPEILKVVLKSEPSYCDLSNGSANATISGGVPPYNFSWSPSGNTSSTLANAPAGTYQLTVTDKNNCTAAASTTILNNNPAKIYLGDDTTLCPGSTIILSPGIFSRYR